ncbi:hypothetical protein C8A05DRAFT_19753 [Staphylotrichum tortipilum]|uniref:Uncharacterized protein n=1 Tax=Staphylotrichum tortipilum TaxID=2831512 RepID=A0AAN6MBP0_9PEZI|nr:hypothetical protein C8A05DRAFT_19753 [Staphylotrichum longicolle]
MATPAVDAAGLRSPAAAAKELQTIIDRFVRLVRFPAGLGLTAAQIADAIMPSVDAAAFGTHNGKEHKIVEVHATFTAKNSAGKQAFELEIIWDADTPPTNSTQTAHFGWEIYLNKARVYGPGHVFFVPGTVLPNYRMPDLKQIEEPGLRLTKSGVLGTGKVESVTRYYKLEFPKKAVLKA